MTLGQQEFLTSPWQEIEDIIGWPAQACCCSAAPAVKVLLQSPRHSGHVVDLYLCGHHYRRSFAALMETGAATVTRELSAK